MKVLTPATVKRRLAKIAASELAEVDGHEARMKLLSDQRGFLQQRCPHQWKHYYDPAGGPGEDICQICEASK